jgi:hypothetical protein
MTKVTKERLRLSDIVAEAKLLLPYPGVVWDDYKWCIGEYSEKRKHDKRKHNLYFAEIRNNRSENYKPAAKGFADFAKSIIVMRAVKRGLGFSSQGLMSLAMSYLYVTLLQAGISDPTKITYQHFQITVAEISRNCAHKTAYNLGSLLAEVSDFIDDNQLAPFPINFKNPVSQPSHSDGLDEESQAKGMAKMPSEEALKALAKASNSPLNDDERILLRIIDLQVVGGFRAGEVLTIPLNCWVEEIAYGESKNIYSEEMSRTKRYGLRYWAEKGGEPIVKWLPDYAVSLARRAVDDLTELCSDARTTASILETNPDRVPLPENYKPDDLLTRLEIMKVFGLKWRSTRHFIDNKLKIKPVRKGNAIKNYYRVGDIEKALLDFRAPLEIVTMPNGKKQKLSESLCVMFLHQFNPQNTTLRFLPQLVGYRQLITALGSADNALSIFSRRGIRMADGSPMKIPTHSFRHWINTLADQGGLSDIELALWMGRRNINQNAAYKHGTVAQRAKWAKQALEDGTLQGEIVNIYDSINDPIEKEQFVETFMGVIHFTPYGVCTHDFAL